ncbi:PREDICTED: uncharacterized protein LOC106819753 [Priapulus caudatus]|uniref:Uncharacterized protein LOC106819753 n=1 Tax=Priapulus caudatus TaxID=37621 RepID=A0ABM1F5W0_PRICU|nr:PREDICTED: uncharacterized protein LOC106819753 [Priapulus caudatus]
MATARALLLLLACLVTSSRANPTSENLVACSPRDACDPSRPPDVFTQRNCFCDDECVDYDDCCTDAPAVLADKDVAADTTDDPTVGADNNKGTDADATDDAAADTTADNKGTDADATDDAAADTTADNKGTDSTTNADDDDVTSVDENAARWSCGFVSTNGVGTYVKSLCPSAYRDVALRAACESGGDSSSDPAVSLPVTSARTNVTYRNVFCAVCHADAADVAYWVPRGACTYDPVSMRLHTLEQILLNSVHRVRHNRWYLNSNSAYSCRVDVPRPPGVASRRCKPNTGACPVGWPNDAVRRACASHAAYVYARRRPGVYRNAHCALCDGKSLKDFSCQLSYGVKADGRHAIYDSALHLALDMPIGKQPAPPGGEEARACSAAYPQSFYDPFAQACRRVYCDAMAPPGDDCMLREEAPPGAARGFPGTARGLAGPPSGLPGPPRGLPGSPSGLPWFSKTGSLVLHSGSLVLRKDAPAGAASPVASGPETLRCIWIRVRERRRRSSGR